jgi:hypothetical protein
MKRATLLLGALLLVSAAPIYSQTNDTGTTTATAAPAGSMTMSGTVVSSDTSKVVVRTDAGSQMTFKLDGSADVSTIRAGDRVTVTYGNAGGGTYSASDVRMAMNNAPGTTTGGTYNSGSTNSGATTGTNPGSNYNNGSNTGTTNPGSNTGSNYNNPGTTNSGSNTGSMYNSGSNPTGSNSGSAYNPGTGSAYDSGSNTNGNTTGNSNYNSNQRMPRTASFMPLIALLGAIMVGVGLAFRAASRFSS